MRVPLTGCRAFLAIISQESSPELDYLHLSLRLLRPNGSLECCLILRREDLVGLLHRVAAAHEHLAAATFYRLLEAVLSFAADAAGGSTTFHPAFSVRRLLEVCAGEFTVMVSLRLVLLRLDRDSSGTSGGTTSRRSETGGQVVVLWSIQLWSFLFFASRLRRLWDAVWRCDWSGCGGYARIQDNNITAGKSVRVCVRLVVGTDAIHWSSSPRW